MRAVGYTAVVLTAFILLRCVGLRAFEPVSGLVVAPAVRLVLGGKFVASAKTLVLPAPGALVIVVAALSRLVRTGIGGNPGGNGDGAPAG